MYITENEAKASALSERSKNMTDSDIYSKALARYRAAAGKNTIFNNDDVIIFLEKEINYYREKIESMKQHIENMEFLRHTKHPEEKRITRAEFKAAVGAAFNDFANDPKTEGMALVVITLAGMTFAEKMEEILFGKEEA